MRPGSGGWGVDTVLEVLGAIWNPGREAMRVQRDLNVRSIEGTVAAAKRAGYEVCYVDLPEKVSGFATVIEGKPFIAINRAKPRHEVQYTVSHELGHHILHLNPSRHCDPPEILLSEDIQEFQAHMFAATWVLVVSDNDKEKAEVLRQNPESAVLFVAVLMSVGVILVAVLVHVASYLDRRRLSQAEASR